MNTVIKVETSPRAAYVRLVEPFPDKVDRSVSVEKDDSILVDLVDGLPVGIELIDYDPELCLSTALYGLARWVRGDHA